MLTSDPSNTSKYRVYSSPIITYIQCVCPCTAGQAAAGPGRELHVRRLTVITVNERFPPYIIISPRQPIVQPQDNYNLA